MTLLAVFLLALARAPRRPAELRSEPWNEILLGDAARVRLGPAPGRRSVRQRHRLLPGAALPYLLGAIYRLFGHMLTSCACSSAGGALTAMLIAASTRRLATPRAAILAGVFAACTSPPSGTTCRSRPRCP
jgi:hypothetical protein